MCKGGGLKRNRGGIRRLKDIGVYNEKGVRGREENNEGSKYTPSGQMGDI
jgi:hypothetical protein